MARPSATQIRARALQQISGTDIDTAIDSAIVAADDALARHCLFPEYSPGLRTLDREVSASYTLYFDGPDLNASRELTLKLRPIYSVTSVTQDTAGDWTYSETLTEGTDFVLEKETGKLLWHPSSVKPFQRGRRRIKVVCVAGYDLDNNETLMQALAWTIHAWMPYKAANINLTQASRGNLSQTMDKPRVIPAMVAELLQPFVLWERQNGE